MRSCLQEMNFELLRVFWEPSSKKGKITIMKKKFFIIAMIILVGILAALIVIGIRSSRKNNDTLADSDYPFSYMFKKGNLELKLDGHRTPKLNWEAQIQTDGIVEVAQKGSEKRGKAKFIISPKTSGTTRVNFVRALDVAGTKIAVATVTLPLYVSNTASGISLSCLENPVLIKGPDVIGESTSNPVILNNAGNAGEEGENPVKGDIFFAAGKGDWTLESPDGNAEFSFSSDGGKEYAMVSKSGSSDNTQNLSEGALVKTTEIILSSSSLKITEKIKVTFNDNGTVSLARVTSE